MDELRTEELSFRYAGEAEQALSSVSFSVHRGGLTVLCGATGSGKSTLLRLLKRELAPRGEQCGTIRFRGRLLPELSDREAAVRIGFVSQRPEEQIVTDRVWHELAFGLENLGCGPDMMRLRVAETAAFFGIESWFDARTDDLSGGQKQLLNLAAVTAMRPDLLLLDEPTARLDPVAAVEFLSAVGRLNRETGMTVIIAEHRLEEVLPMADRLLILRGGRVAAQGVPRDLCASLPPDAPEARALPAAVRLWRSAGVGGTCPLSVAEARGWLASRLPEEKTDAAAFEPPESEKQPKPKAALSFRDISFRFTRGGRDVLKSASFEVGEGEIFCLLGGNGSGKSTLLRAAAGLLAPYEGEIRLFGEKLRTRGNGSVYYHGAAMLPQDVQTLFLRDTAGEELQDAGYRDPAQIPFGLDRLRDRHPYDLSGGEQQLLALAKVLASRPRLLLLDEPTNGLDPLWRNRIGDQLRSLRDQGVTQLIVTHDTEFASEIADRCAMLFQGEVISAEEPRRFFAENSFYTTPVSRIGRGMLPPCRDAGEMAAVLRKRTEQA